MSQPPNNDDEIFRDSASLQEARRWWRANVDSDEQARALLKAVQMETAKSAKASIVDSLLAYWQVARNSRLLPLGLAAAALVMATLAVFNRPRSSGELASLGTLDFEPQSLVRNLNPSEYEAWVGAKPRLQFSDGNRVTLEHSGGTVAGTWLRQPSSDPSLWEMSIQFGEVTVGSESRTLDARVLLSMPTDGSLMRTGTLTFTFQHSTRPAVSVQRTLSSNR